MLHACASSGRAVHQALPSDGRECEVADRIDQLAAVLVKKTMPSTMTSVMSWATCRLQEACSQALEPLPAPMPHESATAALKTVRFLGRPFHDSFLAAAPEEDVCGSWPGRKPPWNVRPEYTLHEVPRPWRRYEVTVTLPMPSQFSQLPCSRLGSRLMLLVQRTGRRLASRAWGSAIWSWDMGLA